ncbi:unnamed protein product [Amoebophrya sp. A25]|nr:unnamed protein product [Amoebophrya sp. A25]|eukprot:GSA25T00014685001.1
MTETRESPSRGRKGSRGRSPGGKVGSRRVSASPSKNPRTSTNKQLPSDIVAPSSRSSGAFTSSGSVVQRRQATLVQSSAAAVSYIVVSMLMTLLNKQIISKVKFPGTNFLLFCECLIATVLIYPTLKKKRKGAPMDVLKPAHLQHLFLCTAAKAANMYFSFLSMKYTSLPVYNVLKRMSPLVALVLDSFVRSRSYPLLAKVGMLCVLGGALVTGSGDLDFDLLGYACALLAVIGQSSYLVLCARALDKLPGLTHVDVLWYTGFYNMFLFCPMAAGEIRGISEFWSKTEIPGLHLAVVFLLYVFQGTLLNFVTFWCTSVTSPVTTGVCGNMKALLTSLVGVFLFKTNLSPLGWAGFALNSAGGFFYSLSQARAKMAASARSVAKKKTL